MSIRSAYDAIKDICQRFYRGAKRGYEVSQEPQPQTVVVQQPQNDSMRAIKWGFGLPCGCAIFVLLANIVMGGSCLALLGGGAAITNQAIEDAEMEMEQDYQEPDSTTISPEYTPQAESPITYDTPTDEPPPPVIIVAPPEPEPMVSVKTGDTVYHRPSCRIIRYSTVEVLTDTREAAETAGFAPCPHCKP